MNKASPFKLDLDSLPNTLPVFPLSNVLLLPGEKLPLNIFEPRYLNMVFDALKEKRIIGMVRPNEKGDLHPIGCAGRIIAFEEKNDDSLLVVLHGVSRFAISDELPTIRGYRKLVVDYAPFSTDINRPFELVEPSSTALLNNLASYLETLKVKADWAKLQSMPSHRLVNFLSGHLPFSPKEKQNMLEAKSIQERLQLLMAYSEIAIGANSGSHTRH